ncbi:hypothetical protein L935_05870 [Helicobacter pylori PZ5086]|nr:hypothetical protein L935_05870 [Helicobacter pylori PZ5086]
MIVKLKKCFLAFFKKMGLVVKRHKNPNLIKF